MKNLYTVMRVLYDAIAPKQTFLVSARRMGGWHGQGADGTQAPLGGAVRGFTKAYKRERPEALVKVVDFPVAAAPADVAERLLNEALLDPGVVEAGYRNGLRWTLSFEERSAADGQPGLSLNRDTVFVVTGDSGNGLTHGTIAGLVLPDLIQGKAHAWADLYDPKRTRLRGLATHVKEATQSSAPYVDWLRSGDVTSLEDIPRGQGRILRRGHLVHRDRHQPGSSW